MGTIGQSRASQRARRIVAVLLVAFLLVTIPSIAQAAFQATASGSLSSSTYVIPAPASIAGSYTCGTRPSSFNLSLTNYGKVARATGYRLTVTAPDGSSTTQNLTGDTATLNKTSASAGVYTLTLRAMVGTWTGAALSRTYTC